MPDRVLRTILTGRDELTAVLTKAAAETRAFENTVEDANARSAKSASAAASVHKTATQGIVSATKEANQAVDRMGDDLERGGERSGSLLAQGVRSGFVRNSPLIIAAVSAALIAGAPLLTAGAVTLFAGVGAVAAAQSDSVKSAWLGAWQEIKSGAVSDAAVLVPVFQRMAAQIAAGFQEMRPQIREAFSEAGPLIDSFTDSLIDAAQNAMPGLVASIRDGEPVIHGLGDLMESIGTGVSDLFSTLAEHSAASGLSLTELGRSFEILLPLLGELLGQGAELASVMLPLLNTGLGAVLTVAQALGPALPPIVAAFTAFKIAKTVSGWLDGAVGSLANFAEKGGLASGAAGRLASGVGAIGKVLPGVGIAAGLLGAAFAESEQQTNDWAQALNQGGSAAKAAQREMQDFAHTVDETGTGVGGLANFLLPAAGTAWNFYSDDVKEAERRHHEYLVSLTPVETAQRNLDIATRALEEGLGNQSTTEGQLRGLHADVAAATAALAAEQDNLARATKGVTEAQAAQADAARARVDSAFAYQDAVEGNSDAVNRLTEAQAHLAEVQAHLNDTDENTRTSQADVAAAMEGVSDAARGVQRSYEDLAVAAGDKAIANLPAGFDETQASILGAKGSLDELNRIIATGVTLPPELEQYRQTLEGITGQADGAMLAQAQLAAAVGELGFAVESVPGTKSIIIDAPTDELLDRLHELGFTVTELPDGSVQVQADTDAAMGKLGTLSTELTGIDNARPEPAVSLNDDAFTQTYNAAQGNVARLNGERPTPVAALNAGPMNATITTGLGNLANLGAQRPTPTANLNDLASGGLRGIIALINSIPSSRTTTVTTVYQTVGSIPLFGGIGGYRGGAVEGGLIHSYAGGGAVAGGPSGRDTVRALGPDPSARYRLDNGEHILDAHDVDLMGGQSGVYAFRAALNAGQAGAAVQPPTSMPGYGASPAGWGGGATQVLERRTQISVDATGYNDDAIARAIVKRQREDEFLRG